MRSIYSIVLTALRLLNAYNTTIINIMQVLNVFILSVCYGFMFKQTWQLAPELCSDLVTNHHCRYVDILHSHLLINNNVVMVFKWVRVLLTLTGYNDHQHQVVQFICLFFVSPKRYVTLLIESCESLASKKMCP